MERVSGEGFFSYRREIRDERKARKASRSFFSELDRSRGSYGAEEIEPAESDAEVAELMDAVFAAGDALKRESSQDAMEAYKQAVRTFVSVAVRRGFGIEERTSGSSILRRKRFALIKVIDEKLERLIAGLISAQKTQFDVLARVDEINGLIVNLVQ